MPRFGVQVAIDLNLIFVYHCYGKLAAMATKWKSLFQLFEDIESSNLVYRYFLTQEIFFIYFGCQMDLVSTMATRSSILSTINEHSMSNFISWMLWYVDTS